MPFKREIKCGIWTRMCVLDVNADINADWTDLFNNKLFLSGEQPEHRKLAHDL